MKTEEEKLVDYFRSDEGCTLGRLGDLKGLSPAETAIMAMRELTHYRAVFEDLQKLAILRGEPLTVRACSPNG